MNWGYKIIIVYAVFVAGMIFLAYQASTQNIELVTNDYYAKELVYQQKIDETKQAGLLSSPVEINVIGNELVIVFPKDFEAKKITGELTLYCPSDEKKDIKQQINPVGNVVYIKVPENYHGLHYVKISWIAAGIRYYYEKKIII